MLEYRYYGTLKDYEIIIYTQLEFLTTAKNKEKLRELKVRCNNRKLQKNDR